jgi:NAD(P)-dependent dehydrogenase (short-subunit alcohol dehydrogenase family)
MYGLEGKVAIVTGAAAGIGRGIAERLISEGCLVTLVDREAAALEDTTSTLHALHGGVLSVECDVADAADVARAVDVTVSTHGPVDILVNNAGIWRLKPYVEHTDADMEQQLRVNVMGAHLFMSRVLPSMYERRRGSVINIASIAASHYTVPHAGYAATKAAISALTRDAGFEAAHHGVRINAISPGNVHSTLEGMDTTGTAAIPMGPGQPSDVAAVVAFLASDEARFIVGVTIPVCGGIDIWVSAGFNPNVVATWKPRERA